MRDFLKNTSKKIQVTSKGVYKKAKSKVNMVSDLIETKAHAAAVKTGQMKRAAQVKKNTYVDFNMINIKLFFHFNVLTKFK